MGRYCSYFLPKKVSPNLSLRNPAISVDVPPCRERRSCRGKHGAAQCSAEINCFFFKRLAGALPLAAAMDVGDDADGLSLLVRL